MMFTTSIGHLDVAAATVMAGVPITQVNHLMKMLHVPFPTAPVFSCNIRNYLSKAVMGIYQDKQKEVTGAMLFFYYLVTYIEDEKSNTMKSNTVILCSSVISYCLC